MINKEWKKVLLRSGVILAATAGVTASIIYRSEQDYSPVSSERKLQSNQIVFSGNTDTTKKQETGNGSESELWEKDARAEDQGIPQREKEAQYLFKEELPGESTKKLAALENRGESEGGSSAENTTVNGNTGANPGGIAGDGILYDVVDDGQDADLIIGGGDYDGDGGTVIFPDQKTDDGESPKPSDPEPVTPVKPTPGKPEETPTKDLTQTVKDPEPEKSNPTLGTDSGNVVNKPYKDGVTVAENTNGGDDNINVIIRKALVNGRSNLYKGQSVDAMTIYCALETYVRGADGAQYIWGTGDLDQYVRIDGVSFDGGKTFETSFPVVIPADIEEGDMIIKVSYRLSVNDKEWTERNVSYDAEDTRLLVLSRALTEEDEVINAADVVNPDQYPSLNSYVNLYRLLGDFLGKGSITQLFPGWMENGKLVPWFYKTETGRHILQPADMVDLPEGYTAGMTWIFLEDGNSSVGTGTSSLCYLQTLTGVDLDVIQNSASKLTVESGKKVLEIPEYIQAVKLSTDVTGQTDYVSIPDTVIYLEAIGGLQVEEGYLVEEGNERYASTDDGLLVNKAGTQICAVPYGKTKLTVSDKIDQVTLFGENQLSYVAFEADSLEKMPSINTEYLKNCRIVVKDELVEEYLNTLGEAGSVGRKNLVAAASEPGLGYFLDKGALINEQGELEKVTTKGSSLTISDYVKTVKKDAFSEAGNVTAVILPKDGSLVTFEKDCLKDSGVLSVQCYSQKQFESMADQMAQAGAPQALVELVSVSLEGYEYYVSEQNGEQKGTLIEAPKDVELFDGTVTAQDGTPVTISQIGDNAFAECTLLEWVELPESVERVGYQAFYNCTSLQGLMMYNTEQITLGNRALEGCESLRFAASNAMTGIFEDEYDPIIADTSGLQAADSYFFYVPTGSLGYTAHCVSFTEESGVHGYCFVDIGAGNKMLYGVDESKEPWLALRSGLVMAENTVLPVSTSEIFEYALAGTVSENGEGYSLNWEDLINLWAMDSYAIAYSQISDTVTFSQEGYYYYLGEGVFAGCTQISHVILPGCAQDASEFLFSGCSGLETVEYGSFAYGTGFFMGSFTGCENLEDIYIREYSVPSLVFYTGGQFLFNYDWTAEEEMEHLRIHVPEGMEEQYIMEWRLLLGGYFDTGAESAYQNLWNDVMFDLFFENWEMPEDEEVDAKSVEKVVGLENRVRTLLGMELVTTPTEFFPYRVSDDGMVTLTGAYTENTFLMLDTMGLGLPNGWYLDYVGTGAFSNCTNLEMVIIPYNLVGIYPNAFKGVESKSLLLYMEGDVPPSLMGWSEDEPFSFGVPDEAINLMVPFGSEETYVEAWAPALAGSEDEEVLNEAKKRLRKMLGVSDQTVSGSDAAVFSVSGNDVSGNEAQEDGLSKKDSVAEDFSVTAGDASAVEEDKDKKENGR